MPQMKSLRNFRLATTTGFVCLVESNTPFFCPDNAVEDAMKAGCVPVNEEDIPFYEDQARARVDFTGTLRQSIIYLAISTIVKENSTKNFDAGGMPKLEVVADRLGMTVGAAELRDLFQQFLSNKADGKEYEIHPQAARVVDVLEASTKAELREMCEEFGIDAEAHKLSGMNMKELRKILLVKLSGITQD